MDMGGMGFSLGGTLGTFLYFFIKLLIIILSVVVILGIVAWIKETFLNNRNSKLFEDIRRDPVLKSVSIITISIVGLILIFALLHSMIAPNMTGNFNVAFNPSFAMQGLLVTLIRVLMLIFIISLILASIMYFKNLYESGKLNKFVSSLNNNESLDNSTSNDKEPKI